MRLVPVESPCLVAGDNPMLVWLPKDEVERPHVHHGRATNVPHGVVRLRKVLPEENRWWPLAARHVLAVVPERIRGVYLIGDSEGTPIYAGESPDLRNALRRHAEGESEEATCIRAHGATQFLFTVVRANRATREEEWQELIDFYKPPSNR